MRNPFHLLLVLLIIFASAGQVYSQSAVSKKLRHVVMFGWNQDADPAQISKIVDAFGALPSKIALIKGYEWGTNNSPEKLNQGLTHCFFLTFNSEADRDAYLVHPAHQEFVKLLKPAPAKVTVLDYWTN
ncbi:MAG: Dabb family protein [Bacteroidetes bacterium]|nr:Dabb family protein [Bacteroidota bacterium]